MWSRLVRLFKHRWADDSSRTISSSTLKHLTERVGESERLHSGEIRICIEAGLPNSYLLRAQPTPVLTRQRALAQFSKLRVWDTEHNNGVLIYLLLAEHAIEVVADRGLNDCMSSADWQALVKRLGAALREGRFEEGLAQAVDEVSQVLQAHFALTGSQANPDELSNAPALG